jgi:hypothetical protein
VDHHVDTTGPTKIVAVNPKNVQFSGDNLITKDSTLPLGKTLAPTEILDLDEPASVGITVERNGARISCEAYYPKPLPPSDDHLPKPPPSIAEDISNGKAFVVSFGALPNGRIGNIAQYRDLKGVYTDGTKEWRTYGINADGAYVDVSMPANDGLPREHRLSMWGAAFTFDDLGSVFYSGSWQPGPKVGTLTVLKN